MAVFLNVNDPDFETAFATLLGAKREDSPDVQNVVAEIISEVRAGGDEAVLRLTKKFDRIALTVDQMRFSQDQIARYCAEVVESTGGSGKFSGLALTDTTSRTCCLSHARSSRRPITELMPCISS